MCSPLPDATFFKCTLTFFMEGSWKLGFWRVFLVPDVPVTVPSLGSSHQPQAFFFLSQEARVPCGRSYPSSPSSSLSVLGAFFFPPTLLLASWPPFPFQWYSQSRFWGCFIGSCPAVFLQRLGIQVPFAAAQQLCPSAFLAGTFDHL